MKVALQLLLLLFVLNSCNQFRKKTFREISPERSGIDFNNILVENDTLNYLNFPYMYMGGGVSVGDINNDQLPDIFFTGNVVDNRLYLNKGKMKFEDITEKAGLSKQSQWCTGTTMADVNSDGWLDIYVSVSAKYKPTGNLLYINNKDNTFTECAAQYGIDDQSSTVQSVFFDYNNDDLLDLYVANYPVILVSMGAQYYRLKMDENRFEESGHLYRNNGNGSFTDVTDEAGVRNFGMSIGVVAMDFNNDGWKDIYVSNDFNVPDYLYQNNGDGTFTDIIREATFQTSLFGMGFDAADINNDELLDFYQIDMTPEDHVRAQINVLPMGRATFYKSLEYGFHYQYMQNVMQLNNGIFNNIPVFSSISLLAGTAHTDWSWGGLFMDMDNDGNKDLLVTNGVLKDINNRDILDDSRSNIYFTNKKEYRPELFPSTPVRNYVYRNNGDLTFTNKAEEWGFGKPGFSNGLAFGDLDNDGDLDAVISNINDFAGIYENKVVPGENHFLKIELKGTVTNPFGLGSIVLVKTNDIIQKEELTLTRGYQSSVPATIHFGVGKAAVIDEITIIWPDRKQQILQHVNADQTIILKYAEAQSATIQYAETTSFLKDITASSGIQFIHREDKYDDFEYEPLLPYKNSQLGPGLAVGDINGDSLDDFFIGNAESSASAMYVQTATGTFEKIQGPWMADSIYEDTGALLFDADGDGRTDLYVVNGGNNERKKEDYYQDRLYLNTDKGFVKSLNALPSLIDRSGKCVKAEDFDNDGDLDLFIGGRLIPAKYPLPANSYILMNNGKKGADLKFENMTEKIAPELLNAGLVTDAIWDDYDSDGDADLIITGEWMKIRFFENSDGRFIDVTDKLGFGETTGWWFSINAADIDDDGDNDYLVGNLGLNFKYKANDEELFEIYSNDYDVNGKQDIVLGYREKGKYYPVNSFDATSRQIPVIRLRYKGYEEFATATLPEIYGEKMLDASLHYRINSFASIWIENKGNAEFERHQLPNMAQFSSINDMVKIPYRNEDTVFMIAGNLYNSEVETPRNDASIGLLLKYGKGGKLDAIPPAKSKLYLKGEVKVMAIIRLASGKNALLVAFNNDGLKLFELN